MKKEDTTAKPKTARQLVQNHTAALKIVALKNKAKGDRLFAVHGKNNHNQLIRTDEKGSFFEVLKADAENSFENFVASIK